MQTQKLVLPSRQGATRWTIDTTHTTAEYSLRHLFTHFRGVFRGVEGSITHDPANPDLTKVVARIDTRNIDTGLADRDAHLRSPEFFDVEKNPYMLFESRRVEEREGPIGIMEGDLTIRGVTRPVKFDVEFLGEGPDAWGGHRAGAIARASIDRKDFGMVWNTALDHGGIVLGDKVDIEVHLEAIRQDAPEAN